jgi:cobalt-precorrin-5B (C1)-methyltransferase
MAQTGYTLPVFSVAAAKAALLSLLSPATPLDSVTLELLPEVADIPIQQAATLDASSALAISATLAIT